MGEQEIELVLLDGKKRTVKEIADITGRNIATVNRSLKQMLKSNQLKIERTYTKIRGVNDHFYERKVTFFFIEKEESN